MDPAKEGEHVRLDRLVDFCFFFCCYIDRQIDLFCRARHYTNYSDTIIFKTPHKSLKGDKMPAPPKIETKRKMCNFSKCQRN